MGQIVLFITLFVLSSQQPQQPCIHGCNNGFYYHVCENQTQFWCHDAGTCQGCLNVDSVRPNVDYYSPEQNQYLSFLSVSNHNFSSTPYFESETNREYIGYRCPIDYVVPILGQSNTTLLGALKCDQKIINEFADNGEFYMSLRAEGGSYHSIVKVTAYAVGTYVYDKNT